MQEKDDMQKMREKGSDKQRLIFVQGGEERDWGEKKYQDGRWLNIAMQHVRRASLEIMQLRIASSHRGCLRCPHQPTIQPPGPSCVRRDTQDNTQTLAPPVARPSPITVSRFVPCCGPHSTPASGARYGYFCLDFLFRGHSARFLSSCSRAANISRVSSQPIAVAAHRFVTPPSGILHNWYGLY